MCLGGPDDPGLGLHYTSFHHPQAQTAGMMKHGRTRSKRAIWAPSVRPALPLTPAHDRIEPTRLEEAGQHVRTPLPVGEAWFTQHLTRKTTALIQKCQSFSVSDRCASDAQRRK